MTLVPALFALLVSMAFTLLATYDQHAATLVAAPVALLAIGLVARSKSHR